MIDRDRLKSMLVRHEGLRLKPYVDTVGKTTIGVGRNLTDRGISEDTAYQMLDEDMDLAIADCRRGIPFFDRLSDVRQMVLADMCFNMGLPGLMTFQKMLGALEAGDYRLAAGEALDSKWAKQVGQRAEELARMMVEG